LERRLVQALALHEARLSGVIHIIGILTGACAGERGLPGLFGLGRPSTAGRELRQANQATAITDGINAARYPSRKTFIGISIAPSAMNYLPAR
jgi:hypothetical protein